MELHDFKNHMRVTFDKVSHILDLHGEYGADHVFDAFQPWEVAAVEAMACRGYGAAVWGGNVLPGTPAPEFTEADWWDVYNSCGVLAHA